MKRNFKGPSRIHLALNTKFLDQSIEFYKALFNIEPSKTKPGYAKFEVNNPPLNLTLNYSKEVTGNRLNHLGIEVKVERDVHEQNVRLKKMGMETLPEKSTVCCYALQDKVWVKDPDGNAWETFFVFSDSEEKDNYGSSTVCCNPEKNSGSSCGL